MCFTDKGIAKIAKKLGFDFAEAVVCACFQPPFASSFLIMFCQTSFEFKKRRAFPVLEGIVIAKENEEVLLEVRRCLFYLLILFIDIDSNRHSGNRSE